jgi:hypothetical protein
VLTLLGEILVKAVFVICAVVVFVGGLWLLGDDDDYRG